MRQSVDITLSVTDADGDDLTISIVSDVSNGTTSLSGSTVTYTPTANYDGTDTFTYKANDGTVDSNIATGTITITDTNQAPIANDMSFSLDRGASIDLTLNASDPDVSSTIKSTSALPSPIITSSCVSSFTFKNTVPPCFINLISLSVLKSK